MTYIESRDDRKNGIVGKIRGFLRRSSAANSYPADSSAPPSPENRNPDPPAQPTPLTREAAQVPQPPQPQPDTQPDPLSVGNLHVGPDPGARMLDHLVCAALLEDNRTVVVMDSDAGRPLAWTEQAARCTDPDGRSLYFTPERMDSFVAALHAVVRSGPAVLAVSDRDRLPPQFWQAEWLCKAGQEQRLTMMTRGAGTADAVLARMAEHPPEISVTRHLFIDRISVTPSRWEGEQVKFLQEIQPPLPSGGEEDQWLLGVTAGGRVVSMPLLPGTVICLEERGTARTDCLEAMFRLNSRQERRQPFYLTCFTDHELQPDSPYPVQSTVLLPDSPDWDWVFEVCADQLNRFVDQSGHLMLVMDLEHLPEQVPERLLRYAGLARSRKVQVSFAYRGSPAQPSPEQTVIPVLPGRVGRFEKSWFRLGAPGQPEQTGEG